MKRKTTKPRVLCMAESINKDANRFSPHRCYKRKGHKPPHECGVSKLWGDRCGYRWTGKEKDRA